MKLTLGQIADWIHAEGEFDSAEEAVGYSIDSRTIGAGELFFCACAGSGWMGTILLRPRWRMERWRWW